MYAAEVPKTRHQRPRTPSSRPAKQLVPASTPSESPQQSQPKFSTQPESSQTVQNHLMFPTKQPQSSSAAGDGIEGVSMETEGGCVGGKEMSEDGSRRCRSSSERGFKV